MRILVVGCGSIGTRRAKLLARMGHDVFGCDNDWDGSAVFKACSDDLETALAVANDDLDAVFICTPPDSGRPEQIQQCVKHGVKGLFVEKPLADNASDVDEIWHTVIRDKRLQETVTMGACNLRFVGGVAGLRKMAKPWRLATFRMRQAAKFWNPAHKPISLILDSIHELDLAVHLQGPIESIRGWSETDVAEASVHHVAGGLSHIFLDRKADPAVRDVKIVTGSDYSSLMLRTDDAMYRREMRHFLRCVETGEPTGNSLGEAAQTCMRALEIA